MFQIKKKRSHRKEVSVESNFALFDLNIVQNIVYSSVKKFAAFLDNFKRFFELRQSRIEGCIRKHNFNELSNAIQRSF